MGTNSAAACWSVILADSSGSDLAIDGLWALVFDHEEVPGHECEFEAERLYFMAGPNGENDGLLGAIRPIFPFISPAH